MKLLLVILLCASLRISVDCARILAVFHMPAKSHYILGSNLLKGLAAKGHDVTMASPFMEKESIPNYRNIYLEGVAEIMDALNEEHTQLQNTSVWERFSKIGEAIYQLAELTLKSKGMQNIMKSDEIFDAVIIESFGNEAFFGLGYRFQCPVIVYCTTSSQFTNHITGNVAPYSFVPQMMTGYTDKMTFVERFINTVAGLAFELLRNMYQIPRQEQLYREIFKDGPELQELVRNVSLALINSHVLLETPRPYLPNMIPVGGHHILEPKNLTKELQQFLDDAKYGVIYFSLGSRIKSNQLPEETKREILKAFGKLKQKVLWKFEDENLPGKPNNVKIEKWLPQCDILAHPNIKIFITHGGLLSSTEALYRGVPIISIISSGGGGDQKANAVNFVKSGYGLLLENKDLTEEKLSQAINEILDNPNYRENIKKNSNIIKDQPVKPLDNAIFWIEHIIRHGGDHLRSASADLTWGQYLLLDVVVFISAVLGTFIVGVCLVFKRLCCSRKNVDKLKRS